jgi:predicted nucleotidyltransferase
MADLDLRPERRDLVAEQMLARLKSAVSGSDAGLRGSLASGSADGFSDIDAFWIVPDNCFASALGLAGEALGAVRPVSSLRVDPSLARSDRRRLLFVRFADLPLFWRVDLDVRARSVSGNDHYDDDNPAARSDAGWSRPASAIENATAAVKAAARHHDETAAGLLSRGLADFCAADDPALADRAAELREVVDALVSADQLPQTLHA